MASYRVVKKVMLAKRETLYLLLTNMCFKLSTQFSYLPTGFIEMLENFQELFSKDIPWGATLPNKVAHRANLKESGQADPEGLGVGEQESMCCVHDTSAQEKWVLVYVYELPFNKCDHY
ncbi:hypothetical protein CR513_04978, partial [Mucuna pruriens]